MNCQEVMEYMQRQLDGDLDEQETLILMSHTRHCPNCSAMFERLQLLSSGLESLPKVTPSYSLVDAIMPRLQELQTTAAVVSESRQSADEEEQVPAINRRGPRGRASGWWKDRFSLRALGGVIAAGVVVGLFLVNYHPGATLNSNGDSGNDTMLTADTTASSDQAVTGSSGSSESAANEPKADMEVKTEIAPTSSSNAHEKSMAVNNQYGTETESKSIDPNGAPLMNDYKAGADTPANKAASPNYELSGTKDTTDTGTNDSDSGTNHSFTNSSGTNNSAKTDNNSNQESYNKGIASNNANDKIMMKDSAALHFTSSELQAVSQDGKYKAFVVDQTVQVYSVEDNVKQFESASRPAGITSLAWSPDSKTITYETPSADGKSKLRYTVDIAKGSEQLQAQ